MSANASTDPFQVVSLSLRNKYKGESLWPAAVVGRTDPLMAGMFIPAKRRKKKRNGHWSRWSEFWNLLLSLLVIDEFLKTGQFDNCRPV